LILIRGAALLLTALRGRGISARVRARLAAGDRPGALDTCRRRGGALARLLGAMVECLSEPRQRQEDRLSEAMLAESAALSRFGSSIMVLAAVSPLLGLLGTVTGMISTFDVITEFGTGDPKLLSGGISEALITTKFGLIVAIPSLLLHAFLSRKAKGITDQMEKAAVAFVNQVMRTRGSQRREGGGAPELQGGGGKADPELVREQVNEILKDILGPGAPESREGGGELAGTTRP